MTSPPVPGDQHSAFCLYQFCVSGTHRSGTIHYWFFCVWLNSLSVMFLRFLQAVACVACVRVSFLLRAEGYPWPHTALWFIHPSSRGHLGCFHLLAVVNDAAMDTGAPVPGRALAVSYFGRIPLSRTATADGDTVLMLLTDCCIVFHSSCVILRPHWQQGTRVLIAPYAH